MYGNSPLYIAGKTPCIHRNRSAIIEVIVVGLYFYLMLGNASNKTFIIHYSNAFCNSFVGNSATLVIAGTQQSVRKRSEYRSRIMLNWGLANPNSCFLPPVSRMKTNSQRFTVIIHHHHHHHRSCCLAFDSQTFVQPCKHKHNV